MDEIVCLCVCYFCGKLSDKLKHLPRNWSVFQLNIPVLRELWGSATFKPPSIPFSTTHFNIHTFTKTLTKLTFQSLFISKQSTQNGNDNCVAMLYTGSCYKRSKLQVIVCKILCAKSNRYIINAIKMLYSIDFESLIYLHLWFDSNMNSSVHLNIEYYVDKWVHVLGLFYSKTNTILCIYQNASEMLLVRNYIS